jgi:hypothetical protein
VKYGFGANKTADNRKSMTNHFFPTLICTALIYATSSAAQLAVTVMPPKITGQKAVVQLKMKNSLADKVESARAVCFLLDEQGQMVGQSTKWVIGQNKAGLAPKAETSYNFVMTSPHPFTTTNLTAKVSFSRIILENGQIADVNKTVSIMTPIP